jgi:HK97 family phage major capsid protein
MDSTTPALDFKALQDRIEKLHQEGAALMEKLNHPSSDVAEVKTDLKSVQDDLRGLMQERDRALIEVELQNTKAQVKTLSEALDDLRSWNPEAGRKASGSDSDSPYASGEFSVFQDIAAARKGGDRKAMERLEKAMTEGTASAGGYLVQNELQNELIELKLNKAPLRGVIPALAVNSDTVEWIEQTGGLTAGWVAELAAKPSADMTFGTFNVNVFTAAGLAVVSNQLLADAGKQRTGPSMSVDSLIVREIARRLAILEEQAIINGSGSGQPLGILGTSGVNSIVYTDASPTVPELLDQIVDAIGAVQDSFKGDPNLIVMHPRTWAYIIKARESASPTTYIVGPPSGIGRRPHESIPGGVKRQGFAGELFGYPVITTANMPTNLGVGVNESRVIVGAFDEALILDRQAVTFDTSEHVYFTSNQTVFRGEMRVGFTAARYPEAFSVISGTGLAGV